MAWRWLRLPLDVFFLGTAIPLDFSQTKSFHRHLPFRQIAKLKTKIPTGVSSSVSSDLPVNLGLVRAPQPSYTQLLQQLRAGTVKELLLSPGQRQVKVTYAESWFHNPFGSDTGYTVLKVEPLTDI